MTRPLRVYVAGLRAGEIELDAEAAHYVSRVHRLLEGAEFVAFEPSIEQEALAHVISVTKHGVRCRVEPLTRAPLPQPRHVTLLYALAKGDKVDRVIRDTTTLAVKRIVIVATQRCVVRLDDERRTHRAQRWQTIAVDSARQCGRGDVPEIVGPLSLAEALHGGEAGFGLGLCLDPAAERTLGEALRAWSPEAPAALLIGPEGGLTPEEIGAASAVGFNRVRFGTLTLRTEIAAVAALAALVARL
jgi:16S rRNA (uracil1498-N3)-methyltransferase